MIEICSDQASEVRQGCGKGQNPLLHVRPMMSFEDGQLELHHQLANRRENQAHQPDHHGLSEALSHAERCKVTP